MSDGVVWLLPAAKEIYDNKDEIKSFWKFLINIFSKKNIAITGKPDVGKSVLLHYLNEEGYKKNYRPPNESKAAEKSAVKIGEKKAILTTVPGQDSNPRVQVTNDFLNSSPLDGIIHVVSYGFSSPRHKLEKETLILKGYKTVEDLRNAQLKYELEDLRKTCNFIRESIIKHKKPIWMIIVVAKVDLYFDKINDAEKYYSPYIDNEFSSILKELQGKVGTDNFEWVTTPLCTWMEDFSWNGQVINSSKDFEKRDFYINQFQRLLGDFLVR